MKKDKVEGATLLDIKTYYTVTVLKTVRYCLKDRQIDKWNSMENSEIDLHRCAQLISEKSTKQLHGRIAF